VVVQSIPDLYYTQKVGAFIAKQHLDKPDIVSQHSDQALQRRWRVKLRTQFPFPDVYCGLQSHLLIIPLFGQVTVDHLRQQPWDGEWCDALGTPIECPIIICQEIQQLHHRNQLWGDVHIALVGTARDGHHQLPHDPTVLILVCPSQSTLV
jgi:hypothetical protein